MGKRCEACGHEDAVSRCADCGKPLTATEAIPVRVSGLGFESVCHSCAAQRIRR